MVADIFIINFVVKSYMVLDIVYKNKLYFLMPLSYENNGKRERKEYIFQNWIKLKEERSNTIV